MLALLSPLQQSIKEIKEVVTNPMLSKMLSQSDEIVAIERVDSGYLLYTDESMIEVEVVYEEKAFIGPRKFTLHYSLPKNIKE